MGRIIKVLFASFVIACCILAMVFMLGPYIFDLETVGNTVGGNVGLITIVLTLLVSPVVYRYLR